MFFVIEFVVLFVIVFIIVYTSSKNEEKNKGYNILSINQDVPYYRDIPTSLEDAFFVGSLFGLADNISDFIGAMILKWLKEKKIKLVKENDKIYFDMSNYFKTEDGYERDIYIKLLVASGSNKRLEEHEFAAFFEQDDVIKWLNDMFQEIKDNYEEKGHFKRKVYGFKYQYYISDELKKKAYQLAGLKKFLKDFSRIHEREAIEVVLWEDYLIYAQLLGIADEVEEQMENIYPDFNRIIDYKILKASVFTSLSISLSIVLTSLIGGMGKNK